MVTEEALLTLSAWQRQALERVQSLAGEELFARPFSPAEMEHAAHLMEVHNGKSSNYRQAA